MGAKNENINLMYDFMKGITKVFIVVMIGIFPFYYQNNYINIVAAKSDFFEISAIVLIAMGLVFIIPGFFKEMKIGNAITKFSMTDYFAILFAITIIVSCLLSPAGSEAFLGTQGRQLGGKALLLYIAVYFMVSRYYKSGQLLIWVFFIANCLMCLLISLNFWGIDPLHMRSNLRDSDYLIFMGTLGNININSGYIGVITALFMVLYYIAEEKTSKICFAGAVVLGIYTCFATSCNSWLLAVGGSYLMILALAMKDTGKLKKWWSLCACFLVGSILMKLTERIDTITESGNIWIDNLRNQEQLPIFLDWKIFLLELFLLGIFWFIFMQNKGKQLLEKYGNSILIGTVLTGVAIMAVRFLPFDDDFGSGRGYIWKCTIANFFDMPIIQKLFGYGPNCYLQSMNKLYEDKVQLFGAEPFIDAHNELLQFLTVTGILGMISYMGMQMSLLVNCIRKNKTKRLAAVGCIGITAYMLQGLVNNPQGFTTPLLFLLLGIMDHCINRQTNL